MISYFVKSNLAADKFNERQTIQYQILIRVYISYWLSSIVDSFPRVIKYKSAIFYNSRGDEGLNYQISDFFLQNSHISSAVGGDLPYKLTDIHPVTFYKRRIQDFFLSFTWYKERENINGGIGDI